MQPIQNVVILGSGNLAWHLCQSLKNIGIQIKQIYNHTDVNAEKLAREFGLTFTSQLDLLAEADAYFFVLSDFVIAEILTKRNWQQKLLVHCAGSIEMNVFQSYTSNFGVLYPLQSFTKGKPVDFEQIPLLVEGNTPQNEQTILNLAAKLSKNIRVENSEKRAKIHLAAVFASNYVNFMLGVAYQLMQSQKTDPQLLFPLVKETIEKAFSIGPLAAQTGPARRNNQDTIKKHELMLESNPDWQKLYTFVAEKITTFYQQHDGKF